MGTATALVAAVGALAGPRPALAQQPATAPSAAAASQALRPRSRRPGAGRRRGRDRGRPRRRAPPSTASPRPTPSSATARVARPAGLLARPTDGAADRFGDGYPAGGAGRERREPPLLRLLGLRPRLRRRPGLADAGPRRRVPTTSSRSLAIAEHSYGIEVAPGPLGWAPPKPDTTGLRRRPAPRSDIYLKQIGNRGAVRLRVARPRPGPARAASTATWCSTTTTRRTSSRLREPAVPASVTFAHEFNHLLQQNYDSFQDLWMFESTAVWAEEKVFPQINDYVNYVPRFAQLPGRADDHDVSRRRTAQVAEDLRLGGLEPLARHGRRGLRAPTRSAAPGRSPTSTKPPTSRSPPTTGRSRRSAGAASAASSPRSPRRRRSGGRASATSRTTPCTRT